LPSAIRQFVISRSPVQVGSPAPYFHEESHISLTHICTVGARRAGGCVGPSAHRGAVAPAEDRLRARSPRDQALAERTQQLDKAATPITSAVVAAIARLDAHATTDCRQRREREQDAASSPTEWAPPPSTDSPEVLGSRLWRPMTRRKLRCCVTRCRGLRPAIDDRLR
jgi:hypothetical protein